MLETSELLAKWESLCAPTPQALVWMCVCEGQSKGPLGMAKTYHNFERGASLAEKLPFQTQNPLGKVCSFTREKEWKLALGTSFSAQRSQGVGVPQSSP